MTTRVSYEDMANPRRYGTVTEALEDQWGIMWRVIWDDHDPERSDDTVSDLRQHGWRNEQS